jgi:hypothetical protein
MLTIPGHKGNANENLTPVRITRTSTTNVGEDAGEKEPSYTAGGNVN